MAVDTDDPATMAAIARLRDECRRAKEALSSDTDATVAIFLPGFQTEMRVTRAEFEDIIRPRIHETIEALGRATRSAGLGMEDLDRVLLVGGSSRIPLVAEMVRESTGRPVAVDAHPKHTMALGAAFVAETQRLAAAAAAAAATDEVAAAAAPVAAAGAIAAGAAASGGAADVRPSSEPTLAPVTGATVTSGGGTRRLLPIGLALAGVAVVAAVALGASGILGAGVPGARRRHRPSRSRSSRRHRHRSPPTPSPTPVPTPSPTPVPTPTAAPTPTPTPRGLAANIKGITVSGGRYVVDYEVFNIDEDGIHTTAADMSTSSTTRWPRRRRARRARDPGSSTTARHRSGSTASRTSRARRPRCASSSRAGTTR